MAKLQTVAGLLSEALKLDPREVQGHVEGLRAAERWDGTDLGPVETADLLCACLNLDAKDATAAFHLPFIGAVLANAESLSPMYCDKSDPLVSKFDVPFGGMVAEVLHELSARDLWAPDVIQSASTYCHGANQFASVVLKGPALDYLGKFPADQVETLRMWCFYGYELLPSIVEILFREGALITSATIGGGVLGALGSHLRGAPYALTSIDVPAMDRARAH